MNQFWRHLRGDNILIVLPSYLNLTTAIMFCEQIQTIPYASTYTFDFNSLTYVEPFPMLMIANSLRILISDSLFSKFTHRGIPQGYISHMRFFDHIGITSRKVTASPGNRRYRAITEIKTKLLIEYANVEGREVGTMIQNHANDLSSVLAKSTSSNMFDHFSYTIREILRNVVEHSESEEFAYCAQYWPSKDLAEIGLLDTGMGLRKSLERNPLHLGIDDQTALSLAIKPGVSRTTPKEQKSQGEWRNSGFGLYLTSRICEDVGSFTLISGSVGIFISKAETFMFPVKFRGTGVRIAVRPSKLRDFDSTLTGLREQGFAEIKDQVLGTPMITKSMMYKRR